MTPEQLIVAYLPQVKQTAVNLHRWLPSHLNLDDLISAGTVGLLDAARKFDSRHGVEFAQYAGIRIKGAMLDSLRDMDWAPRHLRKTAREIEKTEQRLSIQLGRVAETQEVAQQMGVSSQQLHRLRTQLHSLETVSLDAPLSSAGVTTEVSEAVASRERDPYEQCLHSEIRAALAQVLAELPWRDRTLLQLYYYEELTMSEIGHVLGIDESRVSQIHAQLLRCLRQQVAGRHALESIVA